MWNNYLPKQCRIMTNDISFKVMCIKEKLIRESQYTRSRNWKLSKKITWKILDVFLATGESSATDLTARKETAVIFSLGRKQGELAISLPLFQSVWPE